MTKRLVYLVLGVTMTVGSYIPALFGYGFLSGWSIVGSIVGLIVGIYIVVKMSGSF